MLPQESACRLGNLGNLGNLGLYLGLLRCRPCRLNGSRKPAPPQLQVCGDLARGRKAGALIFAVILPLPFLPFLLEFMDRIPEMLNLR